jgi:carbon storage regulator
MLVLARNVGETIVIGEDIVLTVVSVKGNRIRLGITAPDSIRVDRGEVHQRRAEFAVREEDLQLLRDPPLIRQALGG